ncbi:Hypothetical_protein [Hexamita inflata]|uniref:Hypothetical_protein n=1 Tax=Hexamita inflata TaxID=28002 RepID=A0AA86TSK3_9EUKA|nr:Hypothetical protein HINF_LOCUS12872 [Hexamita inflata]
MASAPIWPAYKSHAHRLSWRWYLTTELDHKLTCRVAKWVRFLGQLWRVVTGIAGALFIRRTARRTRARHRRSLRLADAKNGRRRKICSCTRNEGRPQYCLQASVCIAAV